MVNFSFARVEITPKASVSLAGFASRENEAITFGIDKLFI